MKNQLLNVLHTYRITLLFYVVLISSFYMGLLISLHLFWYSGWENITADNIDANFNQPVQKAVSMLKPLVIVLNLVALLLILIVKPYWQRILHAIVFLLIAMFSWISLHYIMPLHEVLAVTKDNDIIHSSLDYWMKYNDYRMIIVIITWCISIYLISYRSEQNVKSPISQY